MATSKIYMNSAAAAILALGGFVGNASAAPKMIGVKYNMGNSLDPSDNVGAPGYVQPYWTMAPGGQVEQINISGLANLKDNNGMATSVSVTAWTGTGNSWGDGPPLTTEQKLVADYSANWPSISFDGLNSFAPSGYKVVAYYDGTWWGTVAVTAGAFNASRNVFEGVLGQYTFAWHEGTDSNSGDGIASNYTVFGTDLAPLTSNTFNVRMTDAVNWWVGGLAAVQIVQLPSAATPYETWAGTYAGGATAPVDGDYNHDGVQNGVAFFMGMNGLATNPGVVNGKVTWPKVGTVTSWEVQVSDNLQDWSAATTGVDTTSSPGYVIYTLPTGLSKKFCRLMVVP